MDSTLHNIRQDLRWSCLQNFLCCFEQDVDRLADSFTDIRICNDNFTRQSSYKITTTDGGLQRFATYDRTNVFFNLLGRSLTDKDLEFVADIRNYVIVKFISGDLQIF